MGVTDRRPGEPGAGFETALVAAGGLLLAIGFTTWAGARLAVAFTGGRVNGGVDVWLRTAAAPRPRATAPPRRGDDAATGLPATWLYWTCTALAARRRRCHRSACSWWCGGASTAVERRRRFGQDTEAREATPHDVAPLAIDQRRPTDRADAARPHGRPPASCSPPRTANATR